MEKDRNHEGRFTQQHTDEDVLAAVRAHEPAATSEVGNELGIARQSADYRLRKLRDEGRVNSKKIGASLVWFVAESQEGHSTPVERSEPINSGSLEPIEEPRENEHTATEQTSDDELKEQLQSSLPGSGSVLDDRVNAVLKMYDHLRDKNGDIVRTGELKALIDGEQLGYTSTDSFWTNAVKKNAAQDRPNSLTSLPGVEELGNGRYQYTGE